MFIILNSRPDRLGSNLTWYIMQIVYAHYKKYFIHYHNDSPFSSSLFVQAMIDYIEKYNYNLGETLGNHDHLFTESFIEESQQDWPGNNMIVCNEIHSDLLSYFKEHIYPEFSKLLALRVTRNDAVYRNVVVIPFNKTIAVHLRLDDVVERRDYNGIFSSQYYREKIESGKINIDLETNSNTTKISISDDGPGFPDDISKKIGQPYIVTRSKELGSKAGLGLGTFIGKTLLERKKASLNFLNLKKEGALVTITWKNSDIII